MSGGPTWREGVAGRLHALPLGDPELRGRAAAVLVDDLAAACWGSRTAEVRALSARLVRPAGGPRAEESSLVVGGRAGREEAAAVMAVAACWDELDGGYRPAAGHGGLYVVPAAVAEAEATDLPLADVLDSVAVAYEVVAALARGRRRSRSVHPHSALAPLGAAAAVAWLRHRHPEAVLRAVDVAATLAPSGSNAYPGRGALVRNLWAGAGARTGFLAADAAESGLTAPDDAVQEHLLATPATGSPTDPRWGVLDAYHKPYAACQYTHAAVEAAYALASGPLLGVDPGEVVEVVVATHALAARLDEPQPSNALAAAFSVPHLVAAVLVTGRTDPQALTGGVDDPRVRALRERVVLATDPLTGTPPHDRPARVTVRLPDGSLLAHLTTSARGGPDRPLSRTELADKVDALTATTHPAFGTAARELLHGTLLPDIPVRDVTAALSTPLDRG